MFTFWKRIQKSPFKKNNRAPHPNRTKPNKIKKPVLESPLVWSRTLPLPPLTTAGYSPVGLVSRGGQSCYCRKLRWSRSFTVRWLVLVSGPSGIHRRRLRGRIVWDETVHHLGKGGGFCMQRIKAGLYPLIYYLWRESNAILFAAFNYSRFRFSCVLISVRRHFRLRSQVVRISTF